jgi:hypothetical protein
MQSLKIKAEVGEDHTMMAHLPEKTAAGEHEFILIYNDSSSSKLVDLMQCSGTIDWPEDGLAYQQKIRSITEQAVLLTNDKKLHEIECLQCRALELRP